MKRTILGLLSLVCLLLIGCTQQKLDKSESLRDAYFQIAEKLVNKEEISSKTGRTYNTVKSKVVSSYLNITSSICTKDATTCELAKEDFQTMKKLKRRSSMTYVILLLLGADCLQIRTCPTKSLTDVRTIFAPVFPATKVV